MKEDKCDPKSSKTKLGIESKLQYDKNKQLFSEIQQLVEEKRKTDELKSFQIEQLKQAKEKQEDELIQL